MREEFARDNRREINGYDGQSSINLLKSLTREEILEVLSGGFCHHCEASLDNRIRNLFDNDNKMHFSNDKTRDYDNWHVDASHAWSSTNQRESPPQSLIQTPEHMYSLRPQMYHSSPLHTLMNNELNSFKHPSSEMIIHDRFVGVSSSVDFELSKEEGMT